MELTVNSFTGDRLYLDANVFIYAMEGFRPYDEIISGLFEAIQDRAVHAVTSELTLAELLVVPFRENRPDIVAKYEQMLTQQPSLAVAPVTRSVLYESAGLERVWELDYPTAIHAATASAQSCDFFLTAEKNFKLTEGIRRVLLDEIAPK